MQKLRREISQITAETGRIKSNDKLTSRQKETDNGCLKKPKDTVQLSLVSIKPITTTTTTNFESKQSD